jgi:hypothetical protein
LSRLRELGGFGPTGLHDMYDVDINVTVIDCDKGVIYHDFNIEVMEA